MGPALCTCSFYALDLILSLSPSFPLVRSYILWWANGCYDHEVVQGTVTTKLKGVNRTSGEGIFENAGELTWDEAEYVIPPQVGGWAWWWGLGGVILRKVCPQT